ncbi:MAG: UDP-glucose 4-epimerase GalE [Patescibacteria group bacterium]|nr:UDP-glucose 4-epimerase GalE [Patescibacteria group bacterium]
MKKHVVITGAGGYIGSVATSLFLEAGHTVTAVDSLVRGFRQPLDILRERYGADRVRIVETDVKTGSDAIFENVEPVDTVLHYAAFCNVGESEKHPEMYFDNNIAGTLSLLEAMRKHGVRKLVFSSTCSLYGEPQHETLDESHPVDPKSHPYSESKYMAERVIDWYSRVHGIKYVALRYFNVCGATDDGIIGDSKKPSFHLMQNAVRGALGIAPFYLNYTPVNTADGSPIRDYVNVVDLNRAHLLAVDYLDTIERADLFNLGTGTGNSVLEIIRTVETITGTKLELKEGERRKGDVSKAIASNEKITKKLGWKPVHSIEDSVKSLVTWYTARPNGWEY